MARTQFSGIGGSEFYLHRPGQVQDLVPIYSKQLHSYWKELAPRTRSTNYKFDRIVQEGEFGNAPIVNELTGIPFDDFQTPYSMDVTPVKRGIAFAISTEAMETDQVGVNKRIVPKIAIAFNRTKEQVVADFFNNASASSTNGPDGVPWADASHPLEDGTLVDNEVTTALSITSLEAMVQRLLKHKSHRGDPMPFMGPFVLMVPPDLAMLAERLIGGSEQPQTANREINVAKRRITRVHANPYFTSTTAWGLKSISADQQGLVFLNRRPFKAKMKDDPVKDAVIHACTEMYAVYQDNWRGFEFSDGTGA